MTIGVRIAPLVARQATADVGASGRDVQQIARRLWRDVFDLADLFAADWIGHRDDARPPRQRERAHVRLAAPAAGSTPSISAVVKPYLAMRCRWSADPR